MDDIIERRNMESDLIFALWLIKHNIVFLDIVLHVLGEAMEIEGLDAEGQVAFVEGFVELREVCPGGLLVAEDRQIQIRLGTVGPFDTGAERPDRCRGDVSLDLVQHDPQMIGG